MSKHLILEFAEIPEQENIDFNIIEYDEKLNLNVVKGTKIPAVTFSHQDTQTFSKGGNEGTDSDTDLQNNISMMLETSTQTRRINEETDSDPTYSKLTTMLDTTTQTFVHTEVSDSDKNFHDLQFLSDTRTLTESSEALDSDK